MAVTEVCHNSLAISQKVINLLLEVIQNIKVTYLVPRNKANQNLNLEKKPLKTVQS